MSKSKMNVQQETTDVVVEKETEVQFEVVTGFVSNFQVVEASVMGRRVGRVIIQVGSHAFGFVSERLADCKKREDVELELQNIKYFNDQFKDGLLFEWSPKVLAKNKFD